MNQTETLLWTSSLILACIGIIFGIIASINSAKANSRVKELIMDSFIAEGASQIFFHDLKAIISANKKTLIKLKGNASITYTDYALASSKSRLYPVPRRTRIAFSETEFSDISEFYVNEKQRHDDIFPEAIKNLELLKKKTKIPSATKKNLIKHHADVLASSQKMVKWYSSITQQANNTP